MSLFDLFKNAMPVPPQTPAAQPPQNQLLNTYATMLQNGPYTVTTANTLSANTSKTIPDAILVQAQEVQRKYLEAYMASTPESKVKAKVKKALDDIGAYYCMPLSGGYGNSGVPDIIACVEGHFFGIECKAGKNKPTALQEKHCKDIREAKGSTLVIDETNVENVKHLIIAKLGER